MLDDVVELRIAVMARQIRVAFADLAHQPFNGFNLVVFTRVDLAAMAANCEKIES